MARTSTAFSIGLLLVLACTTAASTQQTGAATSSAQAAPGVTSNDFRYQFSAVAKAVGPSVVTITTQRVREMPGGMRGNPFEGSPFEHFFGPMPHGPREKQRQQGMGSGVIIDSNGTILTNNHVVAHADELKVVLADNREFSAKVVGTDPKTDLAVIRIQAQGLTPAVLGDSDALEVAEWVLAIGAPFGLRQTVSAGIVSAVGRGRVGIADYENFIQTDAAINPGNSGGPLVDLDGRLVGINTAIASRSGGSQGIGFAIPINMAKGVMAQLIDHGAVVRGYLGVMIADLSEELARSFGHKGKGGILVQDVSGDTPAAKAGLRAGDIILERDGKPVGEVGAFRNGIAQIKPGTIVKLTLWREGKQVVVDVKLGELPGERAEARGQKDEGSDFGLGLTDLTPELRQRFGIEAKAGALVAGVESGSIAEQAGLRAGDLVVQVGKTDVASAAQAEKLLAAAGKSVRLRILRAGGGLFVILSRP